MIHFTIQPKLCNNSPKNDFMYERKLHAFVFSHYAYITGKIEACVPKKRNKIVRMSDNLLFEMYGK